MTASQDSYDNMEKKICTKKDLYQNIYHKAYMTKCYGSVLLESRKLLEKISRSVQK